MVNLRPSRLRQSTRKEFVVDLTSLESSGAHLGPLFIISPDNQFQNQGMDFLCNKFLTKMWGLQKECIQDKFVDT